TIPAARSSTARAAAPGTGRPARDAPAARGCPRAAGAGRPAPGASAPGRHGRGPAWRRTAGAARPPRRPAGCRPGAGTGRKSRSWQGDQRGEVEALEPGRHAGEAGLQQTLAMLLEAVGLHDVLDGASLLGDFQLAV